MIERKTEGLQLAGDEIDTEGKFFHVVGSFDAKAKPTVPVTAAHDKLPRLRLTTADLADEELLQRKYAEHVKQFGYTAAVVMVDGVTRLASM